MPELKAETMRNTCSQTGSQAHAYLTFIYNPRSAQIWYHLAGLTILHQLIIKKIIHRHEHRLLGSRQFLNRDFPLRLIYAMSTWQTAKSNQDFLDTEKKRSRVTCALERQRRLLVLGLFHVFQEKVKSLDSSGTALSNHITELALLAENADK